MPINVSLFQRNINGIQYAFDTGDINFGDADTKDIVKNIGNDILSFTLRKRQVTFTIRGANSANVQSLIQAREDSILQVVNATEPVQGEDIVIGGDTIYSAILVDVQAGPPIGIGSTSLVEQVTVVYDSTVFV
ncbi:MAG: hypothetical protein AAGB19_02835 [Cyanobacteria bacterium P01_F01_bin.3]